MNSKVNYSGFTDMFGENHTASEGNEINWLSRLDAAINHPSEKPSGSGIEVLSSQDVLQSD